MRIGKLKITLNKYGGHWYRFGISYHTKGKQLNIHIWNRDLTLWYRG
jgi:hypothetical protein